jgi:putative radical SAM enzyme (TIGR03279 family)
MVRVRSVAPESLAAELGIVPGTELLAIGGRALDDFLDWEFHSADDAFVLRTRTPGGETIEYDVERPEGLPFGVELEPPHVRRCANRCDFCFVDGLPEGLRANLYIRDDDYRLSFRYGNFATLTNLKPRDVARIFEYRLSPLYVSVHVTDTVLRRRYLRNPRAPDVMEQLRSFGAAGIQAHTQIVLQPGVNDGAVLARSLEDLYGLGPAVLSASVVPVGLTDYSKLHLVREPTRDECRAALAVVHRFGDRAARERGHRWAHGSDDLYLIADEPLPPAAWYGEFEQVENGVGSVRFLQERIAAYGTELPRLEGRTVAVLTGTAMGRLMPQVTRGIADRTGGRFEVIALENPLFGRSVTTAALLPGCAFQEALASRADLSLALLPAEAVNDDGLFMDDLSLEALQAAVPCAIRLSHDFGDALVAHMAS